MNIKYRLLYYLELMWISIIIEA